MPIIDPFNTPEAPPVVDPFNVASDTTSQNNTAPTTPPLTQPERLKKDISLVDPRSTTRFVGESALARSNAVSTPPTEPVQTLSPEEAKKFVDISMAKGSIDSNIAQHLKESLQNPIGAQDLTNIIQKASASSNTLESVTQRTVANPTETFVFKIASNAGLDTPQGREALIRAGLPVAGSVVGAIAGAPGGPLVSAEASALGASIGSSIDMTRRNLSTGEQFTPGQVLTNTGSEAAFSLAADSTVGLIKLAAKAVPAVVKVFASLRSSSVGEKEAEALITKLIVDNPNNEAILAAKNTLEAKDAAGITGAVLTADTLGNGILLRTLNAIGSASQKEGKRFAVTAANAAVLDETLLAKNLAETYKKSVPLDELGNTLFDMAQGIGKRVTSQLAKGSKVIGEKELLKKGIKDTVQEKISLVTKIWKTTVDNKYDELTKVASALDKTVDASVFSDKVKGDVIVGSVDLTEVLKFADKVSPRAKIVEMSKGSVNTITGLKVFPKKDAKELVTAGKGVAPLSPTLRQAIGTLQQNPTVVTFSDAHRLRSAILKQVRETEALNPVDSSLGFLRKSAAQITDQMDAAARRIGKKTKGFLSLYNKTNAFFKDGAQKYRNKLVTQLITEDPDKVAKVLLQGDATTWNAAFNVIGKNSKEAGIVKRFYIENIKENLTKNGILDVGKFIDLIDNPNIFKVGSKELFTQKGLDNFVRLQKDFRFARNFISEIASKAEPEDIGKMLFATDNKTNFNTFLRVLSSPSFAKPEVRDKTVRGFLENIIDLSRESIPAGSRSVSDLKGIPKGLQNVTDTGLVTGKVNPKTLGFHITKTYKNKLELIRNFTSDRGRPYKKAIENFTKNVQQISALDNKTSASMFALLFEHGKFQDLVKGGIAGAGAAITFKAKAFFTAATKAGLSIGLKVSTGNLLAKVLTSEEAVKRIIKAVELSQKGDVIASKEIMDKTMKKIVTDYAEDLAAKFTKQLPARDIQGVLSLLKNNTTQESGSNADIGSGVGTPPDTSVNF